ncbi:hypothetical protein [Frateuria sp.]|uniref:hypothetical protein n=1 Tax=Frateuria sp. TaxID=2211372 RepID=UPI003F7D8910
MLKGTFVILVVLNLVAFYFSAERFLISLAPPHLLGECTSGALSQAAHEASNSMQNFLIPAAMWLGGTALADLFFAGAVVFGRSGNGT